MWQTFGKQKNLKFVSSWDCLINLEADDEVGCRLK